MPSLLHLNLLNQRLDSQHLSVWLILLSALYLVQLKQSDDQWLQALLHIQNQGPVIPSNNY